jgi:hypothetical protein
MQSLAVLTVFSERSVQLRRPAESRDRPVSRREYEFNIRVQIEFGRQ